jgi:two-component system sensor histidine kinase TctE
LLADPFSRSLTLLVEDTGPGIPQAERELVFEPFYRALGTNVDGSGLGLAIVAEIAQQHDAQVSIDSCDRPPPLPGTRVIVRLRSPQSPT